MAPGGQEPSAEGEQKPQDGKEESSDNSALLSKSFFGGKDIQVGETVSVKVVAVHGDEIEVEADSGKEEESNENKSSDSPEMSGAMGKMDEMAK